ncbi:Rossmann-like domain-containing protein [Anaerovorax odorimutans]|uniref:Rossmann-like domain-containing protein n=1 Tax=Anaerovorax odorimutans TaxID=109327 RepID=UPI0004141C82|nr:DUF364 domain-containing protein [Anaerovorax odorimutans]
MNKLKDAYEYIIQLYQKEGLTPGHLENIGFCGKWTIALGSNGQSGMAFNFTGEHSVYGEIDPSPLIDLYNFVGKNLTCIAEHLCEKNDILHRSLYLAVLNALSNPLNNEDRLREKGFTFLSSNKLDFVKEDDFVTVIGAGGVLSQLKQRCKKVHVCDMRSKNILENLLIGEEIQKGPKGVIFHSASESEQLLKQSDVVFMTGCTLVNHTIFDLLPMIKNARIIGLFGPSAMLLPDFLSKLGVNYIITSNIIDSNMMQEYILNEFAGKIPEQCMKNYTIKI